MFTAKMEPFESGDAYSPCDLQLKAAQEKAAQYIREQRYTDARRVLKQAAHLQAAEARRQRLVAVQSERDTALVLTNEGRYAEAGQALQRAAELEAFGDAWKVPPQRFFASVRSGLTKRSSDHLPASLNDQTENPEQPLEALVKESSAVVSQYAKVAAGLCFMPIPFFDFAAIMTVQVLLVRRIANLFGHTATKDQIRGLILSLVGAVIPTGIGQGVGAALSLSALPVLVSGAIVYLVATPLIAYALTRAVGNVFIMHFESGGTLLTFDPKAFNEYFVHEFRKAGGILRKVYKPTPVASVTAG